MTDFKNGFRGILIASPGAQRTTLSEPLADHIGQKLGVGPLPLFSPGRLLRQSPEKLSEAGVPDDVAEAVHSHFSNGSKCACGDVHTVLRATLRGKRDWLMTGFPTSADDLPFVMEMDPVPTGMVIVTCEEQDLFEHLLKPWRRARDASFSWLGRQCPIFPKEDRTLRGKTEVLNRQIQAFRENVLPALQQLEAAHHFPVKWLTASFADTEQTLQLVARTFGF